MEQLKHQWNLITMIYDLLTEHYGKRVRAHIYMGHTCCFGNFSDYVVAVPPLLQHSLPLIQSLWWDDTLLRIWSILSLFPSPPLALTHFRAVTAQLVQNKCTRLHEEIYFWTLSNTDHLGWIDHFFYCQEQTKNFLRTRTSCTPINHS